MLVLINKLKGYDARNPKKKKSKKEVLDNAKKLYNIRSDIINAFENKIFFRKSDIDGIAKDFNGKTNTTDKQLDLSKLESKRISDWET